MTSQNIMCTQPGIPEVSVQQHSEQDEVRERWGGEEIWQQGVQGEGTEVRTMSSVMQCENFPPELLAVRVKGKHVPFVELLWVRHKDVPLT